MQINKNTGKEEEKIVAPIPAVTYNEITDKLSEYGATVYGVGSDACTYHALLDKDVLSEEMLQAPDIFDENKETRVELIAVDEKLYKKLCDRADAAYGSNLLINTYAYNDNGRMKTISPFKEGVTEIVMVNAADEIQTIRVGGILDQEDLKEQGFHEMNQYPVRMVVPDIDARYFEWFCTPDDEQAYTEFARKIMDEYYPILTEDSYVEQGYTVRIARVDTMVKMLNIAIVLAEIVLYGFVILLIFMGFTSVVSTLATNIRIRSREFAILKSVGMTNASVKLSLLAGYMCTVAAGLFAGIPLAIPILKIINSSTRSSSGLEVPSDINVGLVLCVILAILLLVAAFIMLKTRRISEATPIKAIRGGRDSVHFSSVLKLPVSGKKLGVSLAYRQFISEKKQYAAAIIVTAILAMFMILMNDMMRWFNSQNMLVDMFSVTKYDLTASFVDEDTQKDIENVISEHTAYRKYQMSSEYLLFDDVQMYCYIVEDPDMINTIRKGRTCTYDNEVLITQYVADGFHMNVGDTVTVKRGGVARKMVISGIYDSANDMGKNFAISKAAYSKFASEETVSESGVSGAAKSSLDEEEWSGKGICYDLDNTDECDAIIQEIDKRYGDNQGITYSIHSAKDDFEEVAGTVNIAIQGLTLLTYMLGAVFVIVTVIIVCGKVLMREQKDIGIYKALGFTSFRLRCQLAVRFIVTAVVGSLLGIVLALIVSKPFFKAGFESFGIYSFNLSTSVISLVIPLVFMSVLFSVVAFIRAGNIRKVQPQVLIADQ